MTDKQIQEELYELHELLNDKLISINEYQAAKQVIEELQQLKHVSH